MEKMVKKILMICMAVLVSCVAFGMSNNMASAMTLNDLQGRYRVVSAADIGFSGRDGEGCLIELKIDNGNLVGICQNKINGFKPGDVMLKDIWVDNGVVHCTTNYSTSYRWMRSIMNVYNNGASLEVVQSDNKRSEKPCWWKMKRVQ